MNRILYLPLLFLLSSVHAQTLYPAGVPDCIARWDFACAESTSVILSDVSGNGHHGTSTDLSSVVGFRMRGCQAMHFNGHTSVAVVPSASSLNPSQISIVALVKFDSFYAGNYQGNNIIYKSFSYNQPGCWAMTIDDNAYDHSNSTFSPAYEQLNYCAGMVNTTSLMPSFINTGQWYLFVVTYDGSTLVRYQVPMSTGTHLSSVSPMATTVPGSPLGTNTEKVYIGATQNATYPYPVNGDMDELALFNRAITNAEVFAIYNYLWSLGVGVGINSLPRTPNPVITITGNVIHIVNPKPGSSITSIVCDVTGHRIATISSKEDVVAVDVSAFPPQVFIVQSKQDDMMAVQKVSSL